MKKIIWFAIVVVIVAVFAVWYLGGMSRPAVAPSETPSSAVPASTSTMTVSSSSAAFAPSAYFNSRIAPALGTYLTDAKGMTLYTFMHDTANKSNCTGACLTKWFPYGPGVSATGTYHLPMLPVNVSVIKGNNGMLQFTWKGMPLYYYYQDRSAGQTLGEGVLNAWYVVRL